MPTPRLARALAAAFLASLAVPGVAHAAALAPLRPCYVSSEPGEREPVDIAGSGYTPNALVDIAFDGTLQRTVQADAAGNLPAQQIMAPYHRKGQRAFNLSANEQNNPVNTATASSNVTALDLTLTPEVARPSRRIRFHGRGFTAAGPVYAHYWFRGRLRKTVQLKRRTAGPCGTFTVRKRQIPVRRVRTGQWTLQVDQQRRYSASPPGVNVRVTIRVQRVFKQQPR